MKKGGKLFSGDKLLLGVLVFSILIGCVSLINAETTMSSPVSGGNYSTSLNITINYDGYNSQNMTNITCYYNASGGAATTWLTEIINTTSYQTAFTNGSINTASVNSANYNISCKVQNGTTINTTISVVVRIDNTYPTNIDFGTGTEVDYANLSQSHIYINITNTTETYEKNITFNIYYSNGTIANSTSYTNKIRWINVTSLVNGNYTYNVTVCDYSNNCNSTATRNILLDTTAPVPTYSCSKTRFSEGESPGSCSCTATDNYDSSPTITFGSPVTTNAGDYTLTCTATDDSTNIGTSTILYTVDGSGGNTGGSGGSVVSKWVHEIKLSDSELNLGQALKLLKKNYRLTFNVKGMGHQVGITAITSTTVTIEVASTPQTATLSIGDIRKFDVDADEYYDISVKLDSISGNDAGLIIAPINEKITVEVVAQEQEKQVTAEEVQSEEIQTATKPNTLVWIIAIVVIVLILVGIVYWIKGNKKKKK